MRHIIDQDDIKKILSLYDNGKSMTYIAVILDISHYAVESIIKRYTNYYTETKFIKYKIDPLVQKEKILRKNNKNAIIDQYSKGISIYEILRMNKTKVFSIDDIIRILIEAGFNVNEDKEIKDILDEKRRVRKFKEQNSFTNKLDIFKNNVKVGDKFLYQTTDYYGNLQEKEIIVTAKYDRFVKTELECISYFDLYHCKKLN